MEIIETPATTFEMSNFFLRFNNNITVPLTKDDIDGFNDKMKIFDTLSDISLTTKCKMDAFKGKYERTSAEQYDEFMKVETQILQPSIISLIFQTSNIKHGNQTPAAISKCKKI